MEDLKFRIREIRNGLGESMYYPEYQNGATWETIRCFNAYAGLIDWTDSFEEAKNAIVRFKDNLEKRKLREQKVEIVHEIGT